MFCKKIAFRIIHSKCPANVPFCSCLFPMLPMLYLSTLSFTPFSVSFLYLYLSWEQKRPFRSHSKWHTIPLSQEYQIPHTYLPDPSGTKPFYSSADEYKYKFHFHISTGYCVRQLNSNYILLLSYHSIAYNGKEEPLSSGAVPLSFMDDSDVVIEDE